MDTLASPPGNQFGEEFGKPAGTEPDDRSGPVFIVGMNGSGTTMLLDCLNNHPAFYGFPLETKILPLHIERADRYGDLTVDENFRALWDELRNIVYFRIVNHRVPPPLPDDWAEHERTMGAVLDAIFRHFAARKGKRRWCEKSPMYLLHMDMLAEVFPDAKFVHVIRDGRDCAASFHRRWRYAPQRTMYRWRSVVSRGRELGRSLGSRYMELRYEALTDDPETHMRRVCEFLEEPFTESVLSIERRRSPQKTLAPKIVRNSEKWRSYFSPREVARLERIGGSLLDELGYKTGNPDGDEDPGALRLSYWRYCDEARRATQSLRLICTTGDPVRRRLMIDKLVTNMRHKRNVGLQ